MAGDIDEVAYIEVFNSTICTWFALLSWQLKRLPHSTALVFSCWNGMIPDSTRRKILQLASSCRTVAALAVFKPAKGDFSQSNHGIRPGVFAFLSLALYPTPNPLQSHWHSCSSAAFSCICAWWNPCAAAVLIELRDANIWLYSLPMIYLWFTLEFLMIYLWFT